MTEAARIVILPVAAGLDPWLTLILLGGASLAGWSDTLPAELGYLAHGPILGSLVALYVVETLVERSPAVGTAWCALQLPVRALAAALSVLFFLPPLPAVTVAGVLVLAAAVGGAIQSLRCTGRLFLHACPEPGLSPTLLGAAEDVVVVALAVLFLDAPGAGAAVAGLVLALLVFGRRWLGATPLVMRLLRGVVRALVDGRSWQPASDIPGWVRDAEPTRGMEASPLRGIPVGACTGRLAGAIDPGWLVVTATGPVLVTRGARTPIPAGELVGLDPGPLWIRAQLTGGPNADGEPGSKESDNRWLVLPRDCPSRSSLEAELGSGHAPVTEAP